MDDTGAVIHEIYPQQPDEWRGIGRAHRETRERILTQTEQHCDLCTATDT